eukprot:scaffold6781_cov204-Amphora_coffeaeformis.AAC.27
MISSVQRFHFTQDAVTAANDGNNKELVAFTETKESILLNSVTLQGLYCSSHTHTSSFDVDFSTTTKDCAFYGLEGEGYSGFVSGDGND